MKRKRGRPKGSKNKKDQDQDQHQHQHLIWEAPLPAYVPPPDVSVPGFINVEDEERLLTLYRLKSAEVKTIIHVILDMTPHMQKESG